MLVRRFRRIYLLFLSLSISALCISASQPTVQAQTSEVADQNQAIGVFGDKAFQRVWERTDDPVASKKAERSWYWGPKPLASAFYENYQEALPYGRRVVLYFDKTRMEINNSATGQVTNGLLVTELITGKIQQGDATFDESLRTGADVPIAGDADNASPTYRQLGLVYNKPDEPFIAPKVGDPITRFWHNYSPTVTPFEDYRNDPLTEVATKEKNFGIPRVFWNFMNRTGTVKNSGRYSEDLVSDWSFSLGLPVTEAYWTQVKVGGELKDVLFQAFERRVLTYTPSNPEAYRVEMGNVGLHYVQWRYKGKLPQAPNSLMSLFDMSQGPQWYQVTSEVLNIRQAPTTEAPGMFSTTSRPFITQLYRGDRIKPIRAVKGEEVTPGNNLWLQIYEKPDQFIYSGFVTRMEVPAFPKPPNTHKGLWVAISIERQMMAFYQDDKIIYRTMIASGRPGYDTVQGSFKLIGGYRPLSQVMEGGNRASGTGYRLEDIRNVTYFFNDYAIHGSYWHAKYGLVTQSHGCVNATVYDASLVHQLPAGTPVEVFYTGQVDEERFADLPRGA